MDEVLKSYYHKVKAIKITKENYQKLKELDLGDGALSLDSFEEHEGEWFVFTMGGFEVWSNVVDLVPVEE